MTRPTIGSLFAGIGGFDLGFERAGFKTSWQVEIDPYATRVLAKNFPEAERFGDIRECGAHNLKRVDVICGGDPCQRNSNAWRHGSGTESPAADFIRIVDELRPRVVVRENPSVVRKDAPWPWWRFRGELEALGYAVLPVRIRSCCVGADHRRERLFLLATFPDTDSSRLEGHERPELERTSGRRQNPDVTRSIGGGTASRICGKFDGISSRMDRLKGLGNAVDPHVTEMIARHVYAAIGT